MIMLESLLHRHLTHDDSDSILCHLDDFNLMSYEVCDNEFKLTYDGEIVGVLKSFDYQFTFESVANEIDHYDGEYEYNYYALEGLLYVVFTEGSDHLRF